MSKQEQALAAVQSKYGFVPNLMQEMSNSPTTLLTYLAAAGELSGGVLSPAEQQVVMLAVSAFNGCHYCTAAHRTVGKGLGVSQADLDAIDAVQPPADARLAKLTGATWALMERRGWLDDEAQAELGLSKEELYEIIATIGLKTLTNYVNHLASTEVDKPFVAQATRRSNAA